ANVRKAVSDLKIDYPVAIDNNFAIWRAFKNQYWPAHYFIDANGNIRHHHFGEGDYAGSERVIQKLLAEAGKANVGDQMVKVSASGAEAASVFADVDSPETYVGYARAANFVSPGGTARDVARDYSGEPKTLNQWTLTGNWTIGPEHAALNSEHGSIVYRFHARDLHLVLGPGPDGKPIRFRVTIDGQEPGSNHGSDTAADGSGMVTNERLYQLVRQSGAIQDRTFAIEFLDPGVKAYAFTFG
ncbi:MAG TPA: cytochrome c biogenesis protein DipZ, partial [Hyphomicrobium sp.]|nr:cytochrome c biogenesis protein DipZ [Hyphomicrobium sp.]